MISHLNRVISGAADTCRRISSPSAGHLEALCKHERDTRVSLRTETTDSV